MTGVQTCALPIFVAVGSAADLLEIMNGTKPESEIQEANVIGETIDGEESE